MLTIIEFDDKGNFLRESQKEKVFNPDWEKTLPDICFRVTRQHETERAFSVPGYENYQKGLYRCICCNNALFSSDTKFNSYTGWPSFWQPIAHENITLLEDRSLGVVRIEVQCTLCDAHLGHVFSDGPEPTGLRFCINTAAMKFIKY